VLDAHLARLEDGLAAARRELSAVRALLDRSEPVMTLSIPAAELAAALTSVRYAAGIDPAHPALHGVLLDAAGGTLHVVATDRYRLAVATVPVAAGDDARVLLPVAVVDAVRALLTGAAGAATVSTDGDSVEVTVDGRSVRAAAGPAADYPDWRRLEPAPAPHRVPLDGATFRAAVAAGPGIRQTRDGVEYETVVLTLGADGELTVGGTGDVLTAGGTGDVLTVGGTGDVLRVGVNRDFLLDALGLHGQLVLELDGPITPLAVRVPGGADWSLLMPVNLADPAPVA
jgi:DNA polymerase III sliding clamp (beta) subunit (PCNA family)